MQLYRAWSEGTAGFWDFLAPHYEHRIPFTRLMFLIDFHYFRGRLAFAHVTNLVSYAALGATLGWVASRGASQWAERALLVAAAVAFSLAPVQVFNLVYPFQLQMSLVCLSALAAFFATARLAAPTTSGRHAAYTALAAGAAILSTYSSANGVAATAMTVALAWALTIGLSARLVITAAAAAALASFFYGFHIHPVTVPQMHPLPQTGEALVSYLGFMCALLGSIAQQRGIDAAVYLGLAGLAVWAAIAVWSLVLWRRRALDTALTTLMALATFAVATALMIAMARGLNGVQQALLTRYGTFSVVFFVSLLGSAWQLAGAARYWPLKVLIAGIGANLLVASYRVPLELHVLIGRVADVDRVVVDLRAGRQDTEPVRKFLLDPEALRPAVEFLRARRLSFFAE